MGNDGYAPALPILLVALAEKSSGSAGEDKKSLDTRKAPFGKIDAGLPTAQKPKGVSHERHTKFITFQVAVPVAYCICSKISKERGIWKNQKRYRRNNTKAMRTKECRDYRGGGMQRSHTYAGGDTAKFECSTVHGISEREEQSDDL